LHLQTTQLHDAKILATLEPNLILLKFHTLFIRIAPPMRQLFLSNQCNPRPDSCSPRSGLYLRKFFEVSCLHPQEYDGR
jgi:hypothetical protein